MFKRILTACLVAQIFLTIDAGDSMMEKIGDTMKNDLSGGPMTKEAVGSSMEETEGPMIKDMGSGSKMKDTEDPVMKEARGPILKEAEGPLMKESVGSMVKEAKDSMKEKNEDPILEEVGDPLLKEDNDPILADEDPKIEDGDPILEDEDPIFEDDDPILEGEDPKIEDGDPISEYEDPMLEDEDLILEEEDPLFENKDTTLKDENLILEDKHPILEDLKREDGYPKMEIGDSKQEHVDLKKKLVTNSRCVRSCKGLEDGDYQSCQGCNVYCSCVGGYMYDSRPCPASLVWDDNKKRCDYTSPTCGKDNNKGCEKGGKLYKIGCTATDGTTYKVGARVPSKTPCIESCRCTISGDIECFPVAFTCLRPDCDNPITVSGQCCSICPKVCTLPVQTGPCDAAIHRYAYDSKSKRCRPFTYGGCEGNGNNFEFLKDCQEACEQKPTNNCTRDNKEYNPGDNVPTENPCRERCRCTEDGISCFRIAVKCARPLCKNPKKVKGKCCPVCPKASQCIDTDVKVYKIDQRIASDNPCKHCVCNSDGRIRCRISGCRVPRCSTKLIRIDGQCCQKCQPRICSLPKKTGRCRARKVRYYYNTQTGRCERFIYGGCGANENNFLTRKTCESRCGLPEKNVCVEGKRTYKMGQRFERNPCTTCTCTVGGKTVCAVRGCVRPACEDYYTPKGQCCPRCPSNDCVEGSKTYRVGQRFKRNPCTFCTCSKGGKASCASIKCARPPCKDYYTPKGECCAKCRPEGCEDTDGNTYKIGEKVDNGDPCQTCICSKDGQIRCKTRPCPVFICLTKLIRIEGECCQECQPKFCSLTKQKGPCEAITERYFYNTETGRCQTFTYGGCEANENNFKTKKDCEKKCGLPENKVCTEGDKTYKVGEKVIRDPCSLCACTASGTVECFVRDCAPPRCENYFVPGGECCPVCPEVCTEGEKTYKIGESYKRDPCTTCTCTEVGVPLCSAIDCMEITCKNAYTPKGECCSVCPEEGCVKNGRRYSVGEKMPSDQACRTGCICTERGEICAIIDCIFPTPCKNPIYVKGQCCPKCPPRGCSYKNKTYREGQYFRDQDTCKICGCRYGKLTCRGRGCPQYKCTTRLIKVKGRCCPICQPPACQQQKQPGLCKAAIPRYYFNQKSGRCERFFYGGCGGNNNNFKNLQTCEKLCGSTSLNVCTYKKRTYKEGQYFRDKDTCKICGCRNGYVTCRGTACPQYKCTTRLIKVKGRCCPICQPPACEQPMKTGLCKAAIPRYYFNKKSGRCERFIYGGCGGNNNNFKNLQTCEKLCGSSEVNVCYLPKVVGPCRAAFPRYYFNPKTGKCTKFTYGGCRGNKNNFRYLKDCRNTCEKETDVCHLPKLPGSCRGSFNRYFYNTLNKTCEQFIYGGCKGNGNNFETLNNCKKACVKRPKISVPRKRNYSTPYSLLNEFV